MSDCGCWRQDGKFVVRVRGSEHLMSKDEVHDILYHLTNVVRGAEESLGQEYAELRESNRRKRSKEPGPDLSGIRAALGLISTKLRRI